MLRYRRPSKAVTERYDHPVRLDDQWCHANCEQGRFALFLFDVKSPRMPNHQIGMEDIHLDKQLISIFFDEFAICQTILSQDKTSLGEDADTPTRRFAADTFPPNWLASDETLLYPKANATVRKGYWRSPSVRAKETG